VPVRDLNFGLPLFLFFFFIPVLKRSPGVHFACPAGLYRKQSNLMSGQSLNPIREPFDLYSTEIDANPFPAYEALREHYPCYWSESGSIWILSRYEDVAKAAQDWQTYSSARGNLIDEIPDRAGGTLGTTDPPRHDRLRALSQAAFMKKNLDHLIEPTIALAHESIDRILGLGDFDFVADFSSEITVGAIFRFLGLPDRDRADTRNKVVLSISTDKAARGRNPDLDRAFRELADFVTEEVGIRRLDPRDDLITRLAEAEIDGDRLTDREVVLTTSMFVVAGIESLSSFMSIFAVNLQEFSDARRRVTSEPDLIAQAIEESLRFNTSAQRFKRVLTRDVELHGQIMRSGDSVALAYGSANRDWRKFENPDFYDIDRRPQGHLGFGLGKHFCIGNQFARLITETAMRCFLARVPDFELRQQDFPWVPSSNFRSPMTLPMRVI
jgi:cytochrome P450